MRTHSLFLLGLLAATFALAEVTNGLKAAHKRTRSFIGRPKSNQTCTGGEGCHCGTGVGPCNEGLVCNISARNPKDTLHNYCSKAPQYLIEAMRCPKGYECPVDYYCKPDPRNSQNNTCRLLCENGLCRCGSPGMRPCGIGQTCGADGICKSTCQGKGCPCSNDMKLLNCAPGFYCYMPNGKPSESRVNRCTATNPAEPCNGGTCHCGQLVRGCPAGLHCAMPSRDPLDIDSNVCEPNAGDQPAKASPGELGSACGHGLQVCRQDLKLKLWCYMPKGNSSAVTENRCITQDECCARAENDKESSQGSRCASPSPIKLPGSVRMIPNCYGYWDRSASDV